jgi:hypothetical protein
MGHQDKGHYAAKHAGGQIDTLVAKKIQTIAKENCVTCSLAHKAAQKLQISPSEIGIQIDLLEYRISECQMGLFGYSDDKKMFDPTIKITSELNDQLDKACKDGRISCLECWDIAKNLKQKRLDVGSACEKKKIKIKPCQIGAF